MFDFVNTSSVPQEEEDMELDVESLGARKSLAGWLGSIAVLGFCGNSLVVLSVILYPKLRTITNVYITSLACSDILLSSTIPWIIVGLVSTRGWPLPNETCILVAVLRFTCSGSSVWHLVAIGFNRMFLITTSNATYTKIYSRVNTGIILFFTWLIPFSVIILPYAIGATDLGYDNGPHLCSDLEDRPDGTENLIHTYLAGTFLTAVPLFIVLCVYLRIYIHIKLHVRKQNAWSSEQQQQQKDTAVATVSSTVQGAGSSDKESGNNKESGGGSNADGTEGQGNSANEKNTRNPTAAAKKPPAKKGNDLETRITKNTFYVVIGFIVCIVPYGFNVLTKIGPDGTPLGQAFLLFNICMNPIIYGTKHPHFRAAIRNIFTGRVSGPLVTSNTVAPVSHTQGTT
ncbi:G-protein coupled receptor moody-like [Strongylocentrotus purpuratus]|uniref:G-protein coupled receptors family 1 profile domain-containing protein n=1 Tax=Strongylocentrotus purpuratus TaxID=7668 RepID=A0A7M7N3V1_STRPU|nr:G-protein coupled receptor moody-like [Strongylocentrotus purpuratus]